ncbi:alpha-(1,3)-fucosyltransferase C-like [Babylonia areolata]|uniref:alpha-(1,3)-fucosyltransferase C-like n=1 Tax=Babylonia areolata TaxID=304850 RepID=UPI003FD1B552
MAVRGLRCRSPVLILVMVMAVGVVALVLQRYAFTLLTPHQAALHRRVLQLKEEGARAPLSGPAGHSGTKVILMHSFPAFYQLQSGPQYFTNCSRPCTLTLDSELVGEVDCVVMYARHFSSPIHPSRSWKQVWVYFAVESPFYSDSDLFGKPHWQHRFNWTMTYRRDSDFYFGYGDIVKPSRAMPVRDFTLLVKNKSKMAAWFVSNCHTQSKREDFVSALKQFVDVDIYGNCGQLKCATEGNQACMDMLSRDYYFYLSFENSMCKDYITEKLYRTMKKVDIVPVVRGGANYSALLPPNSFIDASLFPSVRALAEHLKKVAGDPQLYKQYLAWKNFYQVVEPMNFPFCSLCDRLHSADRWAHVYPNVEKWWQEGVCHDPPAVIKS